MTDDRQKILVAVDGSEQSMRIVRYVAGMCAPQRTAVTLLHILSPVAETFWDLKTTPDNAAGQVEREDQMRRQSAIDAFMVRARQVLLTQGFAGDAVRVAVQPRQAGIAPDIIGEARRGYQAVVSGNTGFNPITRLTMGGVASKLIATLTDRSLWIVGGQPDAQKVLLCLDPSAAAAGVIEHAGRMLAGRSPEVTLFYAIRNPVPDWPAGAEFPPGHPVDRHERAAREAIVPVFKKAVTALEAYGLSADRISVKIVTGVATRAGTIFAQALHGGYGTIIVGRLGVAGQTEFPIGTVPMKLVQLVDDLAVWVVAGE